MLRFWYFLRAKKYEKNKSLFVGHFYHFKDIRIWKKFKRSYIYFRYNLFNCYEYMLIIFSYLFTQMNADSIKSTYFLWPKSNKKTCRKKGDFCFAKPRMILGINNAPGKQDLKDLLYTNSLEASNHRYR